MNFTFLLPFYFPFTILAVCHSGIQFSHLPIFISSDFHCRFSTVIAPLSLLNHSTLASQFPPSAIHFISDPSTPNFRFL